MARKVEFIDNIDKQIGKKIFNLRKIRRLTRQALAEKIGVTHQQLQKYENGVNRVSAGRLFVIAKALGKPVDYFYEDVEDTENPVPVSAEQRQFIEMSHDFMRIKSSTSQTAINTLVKTLAEQ